MVLPILRSLLYSDRGIKIRSGFDGNPSGFSWIVCKSCEPSFVGRGILLSASGSENGSRDVLEGSAGGAVQSSADLENGLWNITDLGVANGSDAWRVWPNRDCGVWVPAREETLE